MKTELKKAIVNFIFENEKLFNLHNSTTEKFRPYLYDSTGNYLIGGEDVANFIKDTVKLLTDY
jgi:hypothetical protein